MNAREMRGALVWAAIWYLGVSEHAEGGFDRGDVVVQIGRVCGKASIDQATHQLRA